MTTALITVIVTLALAGAPIFAALAALAFLGGLGLAGEGSWDQVIAGQVVRVFKLATSAEGTTLATIPLFTFMGYVLAESRTADRLVSWARAVVGWFPGGLAIVTLVVCALFTTVTGASGVTIVVVGGLVMPALVEERYRDRFSLGLVTSSGAIGLLFPPSLPLIIYGIIYGITAQASATSTGDTMTLVDFDLERFLFAGIVPGLVLVGVMAIYSVWVAIRDRVPRHRFVPRAAIATTLVALPELLIPVVMVVSLHLGLQIPEAAAITALYVLVLEMGVFRDVRARVLPRLAREAMKLVGAIFIVIVAATLLTDYFVNARVPDRLTEWMLATIQSKAVFLLALNVLLLVVGCLMDIFSALLIIVPLVTPMASAFGIDPYHLGVVFLLNLEIGYLTPPIGLNLFISAYRFGRPTLELYRAVLPFIGIMLVALALVTYLPQLTPVKSRGDRTRAPAAVAPEGLAGDAADAGVAIHLPDGGVLTPAKCEALKDDPLAHAECMAIFSGWSRCAALADPLDKVECEQAVLAGEPPPGGAGEGDEPAAGEGDEPAAGEGDEPAAGEGGPDAAADAGAPAR